MEQLGEFLGRYQLVRVLGRGAMGVVYEGLDPKLNRQVAVKTILKSQMLDQQLAAEYSARFIREAQAVARLNHPNIVTVFDFGSEAEVAYLVMEFIRGKELKTYLDAKHLFGIAETVNIVCDLLEALDYAHNNGIIHRDIKPANVMLDGGGRVKLTDFGVARLSDGAGQDGTRAGTMVGTPSYMSPEQIKGLPVGAGADLFAAGVLLYQCLSLQKPFIGTSEWDIWQKIVNEDPPPLSTYRDMVPAAIERIVLRALAKDPKDRHPSARALIADLKSAVAGQSFDSEATRLVVGRSALAGIGGEHTGSIASSRAGNRTGATVPPADTSNHTSLQQSSFAQNHEIELEFWRSIKDSGDVEEFQLYLERFPTGSYFDLARRKMSKLTTTATLARADTTGADNAAAADASGALRLEQVQAQARALAEAEQERKRQADESSRATAAQAARRAAEEALALTEEARRKAADEAEQQARRRAAVEAENAARRTAAEVAEKEAQRQAAAVAEKEAQRAAEREADRLAGQESQRKAAEAAEKESQRQAAEAAAQEAQRKAAAAAEKDALKAAAEEAKRKAAEAAEKEAERKAAVAAEREAQRQAAAESAEKEAQRKADELAEKEAQRKAAEAAEKEVQRKAVEAAEKDAQRKAVEAAEKEAQRKAAEAAQKDAQRKAAEAAEKDAQRKEAECQRAAHDASTTPASASSEAGAFDSDLTMAAIGQAAQRRAAEPGFHVEAQAPGKSKAPLFIGAAVVAAILVGGAVMMTSKLDAPAPVASQPAPAHPVEPLQSRPEGRAEVPAAVPPTTPVETPAPPADAKTELAAQNARNEEKKLADKLAADKAKADKLARDKTEAGKLLAKNEAEQLAAQKKEAERIATEKKEAELVAAAKKDAERAAAEKKAADRIAAEKKEAERIAAEKKAAERMAADKEAERLAAEKKEADRIAAEKKRDDAKKADPDALFAKAQAAEGEGKLVEAVRTYKLAYAAGSGQAARKLGDLYSGRGEIGRDYGEQQQWYRKAAAKGIAVPTDGGARR